MDNLGIERVNTPSPRISVSSNEVFSYGVHTHAFVEMVLYEPFDGTVTVGNKELRVNAPCAVLISPLDIHEIRTHSPSGARFIKVGLGAQSAEQTDTSFAATNLDKDGLIVRLFHEMLTAQDDGELLRHLAECITYLIRKCGEPIHARGSGRGAQIAVAAKKIINARFSDDITLISVASELAVSPQYLSSSFRHTFGVTLAHYLTRIRLRYAESLIRTTGESITDICFASGYRSFPHFLRSFKTEYGISPGAYRMEERTR